MPIPFRFNKFISINSPFYSVNELEDVVLFCNKDTIISDFKDTSSQGVNLSLI